MNYFVKLLILGFFTLPYMFLAVGIQTILKPFFPKQMRFLSNLTLSWMCRWLLFCMRTTVRVRGLEYIPPCGCVFMANHQSAVDILIIYAYIRKPVAMIAKKSLGYIPFVGWWMSNLGCYLIDKINPAQALKIFETAAGMIQKENYSVLIYPEGTRSRGKDMNPLRPGSVRLPIMAQCPVVPVTISGSWKLIYGPQKRGRKFIDLVVHPPIFINNDITSPQNDLICQVNNTIKSGFTTENC